MSFQQFYYKNFLMFSLLLVNIFSSIVANDTHTVEKRQIGALARTGALPQGKRSVEVLARNGELPQVRGRKEANSETTQDLLIRELERAEDLSKLRAQALAEKIFQEREAEQFGADKRSVAALARNGELPQKRLSDSMSRSGYLIRPPQETVQPPSDLLDPDDFLADGRTSLIPEFWNERSFRTFLSDAKRSLGSARNFLLDSGINLYNKKNLASLLRDYEFASLRHPLLKEQKVDDTFELTNGHDDDRKNIGASTRLGKREILEKCWDRYQTIEPIDKGNGDRKKRERVTADFDYEEILPEYSSEGIEIDKRFLGRIPQLGRIHQKVQVPSARRRPHLRPNWL